MVSLAQKIRQPLRSRHMRLFALLEEGDFPSPFGFSLCLGGGWWLGGFADEESGGEDIVALFGWNFCGGRVFSDGHIRAGS